MEQIPSLEDYEKRLAAHLSRPTKTLKDPQLPLVSIVTIVRNGGATVEKTIRSVISQDYPNLEYLIVDGGSQDNTLEVVRSFGSKIDFILSEPDRGIYDAFNKGIALSRGEIIGLINADDWYEPGAVRTAVEALSEELPLGAVCGRIRYWDPLGRPTYVFESSVNGLEKENTVNHPTAFVRRSVYEKNGLFREAFGWAGDYEFFVRITKAGVKIRAVEQILANMSLAGVSSVSWWRTYWHFTKVKREHFNTPFRTYREFTWHLLRTASARGLSKVGLEPVVEFYRKRYSTLKKWREPSPDQSKH